MTRILSLSLALLGLILACQEGSAQTWPTRPVRAVVSFAAGGIVDVLARVVLDQLATGLHQPIVVENHPGAGTTIAAALVAKSDPDGQMLLVTSAGHTIAPATFPNLSYDVVRDFAAVIPLGTTANVLVTSPAKGFKTAQELVAAAKAKPGSLNFASAGVGSGTHMSVERFRRSAGIEAVHIPFKGTPEMITELLAGRVDFFFGPVGIVLPQIRAGKLVALAVNGRQRSSALPDVPTIAEAGFVDAEYPNWFGMFLPAATPRAIVDKLYDETRKALQEPNVKQKVAALGIDPLVMTPSEFGAYVKDDVAMNAALVKAVGVKSN
jgi:tripartite-type tricarboxylate transporter receptor subunit TctC